MTVVYVDELFLLNTLVDYLLLLSAARLAGIELRRGWMFLAALVGGLYASLAFFPEWRFLESPWCKIASGVGMALIAYGNSKGLLRVSLIFFGISATFGGGVFALQLLSGGRAVLDLKTVLLSAAGCYGLLTLVFNRGLRHTAKELTSLDLELDGRHCRLTALLDTGNTLSDPVTGRPVVVAEASGIKGLFPPGCCPREEELQDPISALEKRRKDGRRWRLLPYRAVGVSHALLLAVRIDRAKVGGEDYGPALVALSPTPLSDGGNYHALIGA